MLLLFFILLLTSLCYGETVTVESAREVEGDLIAVISQREFPPEHPGLMTIYGGRLVVRQGVNLEPGDSLKLDLGELPKDAFVGLYLDTNRNFMGSGLPEPGELFASEVVRFRGREHATATLNTTLKPRERKRPAWIHELTLQSERLLAAGLSEEDSKVRFLVALPPGYWSSEVDYPVVYIFHGFSGNRWSYINRYRAWREQMKTEPMLIVSLDSFGPFGHHLFLDSPTNGPRFQVLTEEIVPFVEGRYRTNGHRVAYGQSSGGWTAVNLLRQAPELFHGAAATGPDPLILQDWWFGEGQNAYQNPDGSTRMIVEKLNLSLEKFIGYERQTQSAGQFAAFLACFSPEGSDPSGFPWLSPFDLETGEVRPTVWERWLKNDMTRWAQSHPEEARTAFGNRLALFVGEQDEFGLMETAVTFSDTLRELKIPHRLQIVPKAGHSNYLERPEFMTTLWSTLYGLAKKTPREK